MRCLLSTRRAIHYARKAGIDPAGVNGAMTRGGTDHRIDLLMLDGSITSWWPDGTVKPYAAQWDSARTRRCGVRHLIRWC